MSNNKFWVWGYVLDSVPGKAFFVDKSTSCSLETGAKYLQADNVFWLNGLHTLDAFSESQCERLRDIPSVIGGLTHIEANGPGKGNWQIYYVEAAEKLARLSLKYPNIKGAVIDDFRSPVGPSKNMSDEDLHRVSATMKNINPDLKLYLVRYFTTQDHKSLVSCADDFDGLSIWLWNSSDYFWNALYHEDIRQIRELLPGKEIIQGQFLHAYGEGGIPQPMKQLKNQCSKISYALDRKTIDGWCALQSGWFCFESHRKQVEYLRKYWDWYLNTRTVL